MMGMMSAFSCALAVLGWVVAVLALWGLRSRRNTPSLKTVGADSAASCETDTDDRLEVELRARTAFLEAQSESSVNAVLLTTRSGRIVTTNRRFIDLLHVPQEVLATEKGAELLKHVSSLLKDPRPFCDSVAFVREHPHDTRNAEFELRDGTILDGFTGPVVGKDGTLYGRIWWFRDVTEARTQGRALREREQMLRDVVETTSDLVWETAPDAILSYASRRAVDLVGYTPEEVLGKSLLELVPPYARQSMMERIVALRATQAPSLIGNCRCFTRTDTRSSWRQAPSL